MEIVNNNEKKSKFKTLTLPQKQDIDSPHSDRVLYTEKKQYNNANGLRI